MVKANAYGHGIERVFEGLRGADGFALLDLQEAERVRALGWRGPILLLEGVFEPRDLELCSRLGLWHTVHCDEQIDMLATHKTQQPHRVFLKMNSGMNRLGFAPAALPRRLDPAGCAAAGRRDLADDAFQRCRRRAAASRTRCACSSEITRDLPGERTLSNSAASLRFGMDAGVRADWIRPGIAVYGSAPDFPEHDIAHWDLQPTMTLAGRLIAVQELAAGDTVGYGSSFTADAPLRIGVVACGYADGYPRHCTTGTPVLVDGVRTRMVGRVSMDMITVDLTPVPEAGFGSRGHAVGPRVERRRAGHRRGGARRRHRGLRADVRAGAAGAGGRGMKNLGRVVRVLLWQAGQMGARGGTQFFVESDQWCFEFGCQPKIGCIVG